MLYRIIYKNGAVGIPWRGAMHAGRYETRQGGFVVKLYQFGVGDRCVSHYDY